MVTTLRKFTLVSGRIAAWSWTVSEPKGQRDLGRTFRLATPADWAATKISPHASRLQPRLSIPQVCSWDADLS